MKAMLIESYEDLSQEDARHYPVEWGVGLDGSPNPEAWNYVACASKEDAIHLCEFLDGLFNGKEQLQVQLAGCSVAALGGLADPAQKGDYGYSPAYQDVIDLRAKWEKAEAEAAEYFKALQDIGPELTAKVAEVEELKAENERLRAKVGEQHTKLCELLAENDKQFSRAEKAEAELAAARPLIEAAMAACKAKEAYNRNGIAEWAKYMNAIQAVTTVALSFRPSTERAPAEAELARALIKAAEKADLDQLICDSTCAEAGDEQLISDDGKDILAAALALRQRTERAPAGHEKEKADEQGYKRSAD